MGIETKNKYFQQKNIGLKCLKVSILFIYTDIHLILSFIFKKTLCVFGSLEGRFLEMTLKSEII